MKEKSIFPTYPDLVKTVAHVAFEVDNREQAGLKRLDGKDLHAIGSTEFVQTLIEHELVDEFRLVIDSIIVGGGKRIFRDDHALRPLRFLESQVTETGALLVTYAPSGVSR